MATYTVVSRCRRDEASASGAQGSCGGTGLRRIISRTRVRPAGNAILARPACVRIAD